MLKNILIWILVGLKLREPQEQKNYLELLTDLLPFVYAHLAISGAISWLNLKPLPWYKKWLCRLRFYIRFLRLTVIGW